MKCLLFLAGIICVHFNVAAQSMCPKGQSIQVLEAEYSQVRQKAEMYQRSGMGIEYQAELRKLQEITDKFIPTYLEQEIRTFPLTRDTRCLAAIYSEIVGRQVQFQMLPDNSWRVYVDGAVTRERLNDKELAALVNKPR